jgi:hypothetical protein
MEKAKLGTVVLDGMACEGLTTINVETKVVKMRNKSKGADGQHAYVETGINMANMTETEILEHAAKNILIGIIRTRAWKGLSGKAIAETSGTIYDPKDYPSQGRVAQSPKDQFVSAAHKMTKEELAEQLLVLQAMMEQK